MNPDSFAESVAREFGVPEVFEPTAYYDRDGDCIEFFVSDEPYKAQRLDKWVTVYVGRECNDVVGSLVKNIREMLQHFPGLDIDIKGDKIMLSHLLRGPAHAESDAVRKKTYRALLEKLDASPTPIEAELELQGA